MIKEALKKNFSRHAHRYDAYADVQRTTASELAKRLPPDGVSEILEIGCGTGVYTGLLKAKYGSARIGAWDLSREMAELAREKLEDTSVTFWVGDAEKARFKNEFDLVSSSAAFQWFQNPEESLRAYAEALKKKGLIAFSAFGPLTFRELGWSLRQVLPASTTGIASENFLDKEKWRGLLKKHFADVRIEESVVKDRYATLMELFKNIKYTGTRGEGVRVGRPLGRGFIRDLEEVYRKKFGRLDVSYQIFYCRGVK